VTLRQDAAGAILVPGRGLVNLDAERVNKAVMEYDERLRFGYNPANDDWIIYIRMPQSFEAYYYIDDEPVYPCIGFGTSIPAPEYALHRLKAADTLRHGERILNEMNRLNEKWRAERDAEAADHTAEVAERIEFEVRKDGQTDKYTKVFFTDKKGE
jgi:hypothetical protein